MWGRTEKSRWIHKTDSRISAQYGVEERAKMTCIKFTELLLFLLLKQVSSQEPETVLRESGTSIVMGYCFGADYIVVYRSAPDGEQLLGNSSKKNLPNTPPADLQGRILMNEDENLLGMHITGLTELDSGIYRRECWKNHTVAKIHTEQLFVCKEEISPEEIHTNNEGGTEIRCNSASVGLEGNFVRWYQELHPDYKSTLLLDSSVSLEPVIKEMQGFVEARENGALLVLHKTVLQNFPQYYCVVLKGKTCLSFQNIYLPDRSESKEVFASKGERVVLNCTGNGEHLQWETPLGQINSSSPSNNQMYISAGRKPASFSLIIPVISDKHSGTYSCIAPLFEIEYSLFLCPQNTLLKKVASKGENVSLDCSSGLDNHKRVQWYRRVQQETYEIIGDTNDEGVIIPNDLKGRVKLSDSGLLTISGLEITDERMYKCVVINEFVDNLNTEDYNDEDMNEDDFSDEEHSNDIARCHLKQDVFLNISNTGFTKPSNITGPAVAGGLLGLLVVIVIVIVIVIVKKKPCATNRNQDNEQSNEMDRGCTDKLKQSGEDED
ncbi:hypothetical protein AMECASPLE_009150 [Ameca splendens]|uniref:Ig-like domain-containing protein n=1 Tax=Ameca splendens TaxID=208324 RepID=A0ABV0YY19_9TELE